MSHTGFTNNCDHEGIVENDMLCVLRDLWTSGGSGRRREEENQNLLESGLEIVIIIIKKIKTHSLTSFLPKASQAEWCLSCFPISCSSVTSGVEYK